MTDAERQCRRRLRLKHQAKEVERQAIVEANRIKHAKRAVNPTRTMAPRGRNAQLQISVLQERLRLYERVPLHDANGPADELARQIARIYAGTTRRHLWIIIKVTLDRPQQDSALPLARRARWRPSPIGAIPGCAIRAAR